ncbi:aldose 1-epimerase [Apostasia shenzhenica]|uniref:Aldose 1-epimerase n=1 Tax=Apostasia shenzhenica TaxID=1088818 RepID=A0A2I0A6Z2_9ASPA|nr:aldose 1-epimerase [Apostasia shenzhenica]
MERSSIWFVVVLLAITGHCNGEKLGIYELRKGQFSLKVTNWGAAVTSVVLPDSSGDLGDIVLGYDGVSSYVADDRTYFGALVGRVANRIGHAQFSVNGTVYRLYPNDGNNTLHGGLKGFDKQIWNVKEKEDDEFPHITLHYHSPDGDQGFPGALDVYVTYKIEGNYTYSVSMKAFPRNKPTPVNLAQHTYWNLAGHKAGTILKHSVQLYSSRMTPVDEALIPTGEIAPVCGTPFDLRRATVIGRRMGKVSGGFDLNYVVDSAVDCWGLRKVAVVADGRSGRKLELWSDQPGVQFYTGNFLKGVKGKGGAIYRKHSGMCLETQGFPDSVNHPRFPYQIVSPGEIYRHYMRYKFSF